MSTTSSSSIDEHNQQARKRYFRNFKIFIVIISLLFPLFFKQRFAEFGEGKWTKIASLGIRC